MATVEITNSRIIEDVKTTMQDKVKGFISDADVPRAYKSVFIGATSYLAAVKNTKNPVALTIEDEEGNFIIGAVVEYNEAPEQEEDVTGNWMYYWTFNKSDIPEDAVIYEIKNTQTHSVIRKAVWEHTSARFENTESLINTYIIFYSVLRDYLMDNAVEGDEHELNYPGVFTACASVEDGEKVISVTPDGLIKKMIKDDVALETEAKTA